MVFTRSSVKNNAPIVQTKLTIGQPNDQYEQEADAVADQVVKMPANQNASIQRKCDTCEEELQMKPLSNSISPIVQKQSNDSGLIASPNISQSLTQSKGSGQRMDIATQSFMNRGIGADFSNVKIHTNDRAVQMNRSLGAKAFTNGNDVYFNRGQYNPQNSEGKHLLAHELTHVVQQNSNSISPKIQCDFAIAPTHPNTPLSVLTPAQIRSAIRYNSILFSDADEIGIIRDVLGRSKTPSVIDEDFVNGVLSYQSQYGLSQDGKLGIGTSRPLYNEVKAEADYLGQATRGTPLRRVERRLYLRSRIPERRGNIVDQGFVGPDDRPNGVVSVRVNANESATQAGVNRAITLDYTGDDANQVRWLQFANDQLYGTQPGSRTRIYNTGNIATTGGTYPFSQPGSISWNVDTGSTTSPFYDAAGLAVRTPNRSLVMIDQPAALPASMFNTFIASRTPNLDSAISRVTFDAYAVKNNRVIYRVRWYATYRFNIATGTASTARYSVGTTTAVSRLRSSQRTALRARFSGNTIP